MVSLFYFIVEILKYALTVAVAIALWLWFYGLDGRIQRKAIAERRTQIASCLTSCRIDFLLPLIRYGLRGEDLDMKYKEPFNVLFDDFLKCEIDRFFRADESAFTSKQAKMSESQYFALCFSSYLIEREYRQTVCGREMHTVSGILQEHDSYAKKQCTLTDFGISVLEIALASVRYANDIFPNGAYYPSVEERLLREIESGSFTIYA